MHFYKRWNNITGWAVFAVAAMVYLMTMEPVSSLWDCSEFIATSYKLEVGHPPGAPLFMMLARLATLFAFGNPDYVGIAVNAKNSLASAFCILFMFWTVTHLGRRIYSAQGRELTDANMWTVLGAGAVGALAYTFTDTFWFSAVEGEVYALSSMFTALVVWLMLKWEEQADEPHSSRWIVLIAYLMGLSIGVHILNLLTAKFAILPVLYFPSLDRVFGVLVEDSAFLATCLAYSARLLFFGWLGGAVVGMLTGIGIGFNKTFAYWVQPLVRVLGPIPSTAWIPLVLIAFPTAISASAFLIALAVWFPTTVLTSSGIASIPNSYFEVSSTLGAGSFYRIAKVGIPAAMPHMFLGLFNGTCSSFITLVTAEMLGAKYGIGWYINWKKEMMAYANVYAGLIIIAVTFFILITLLFKFRDRVLAWQKGVIKW